MYYILTKKIPLNGGDYAYIRSSFSPKFYTVFGISLWLIYVFSAPVLANLVLLNFNIPIIDKFLTINYKKSRVMRNAEIHFQTGWGTAVILILEN